MTRALICLTMAAHLLLAGCVTSPPAAGGASAYAVGDRVDVSFDEVVVSLRLRGSNVPYQNFHIAIKAFANPVRTTHSSPWDAQGIIQRCEGRMAARVSEALSAVTEPQAIEDVRQLRELARKQAQEVLEAAMHQWEDGGDYRVEVVIASSYWTDASVGRVGTRRSWW